MKRFFLFSIGIIFSLSVFCIEKTDKEILDNYFEYTRFTVIMDTVQQLYMIRNALFFHETPYVAHTLENNDEEQLVVNLRELDCVTLVENVITLRRTGLSRNRTMEQFQEELQFVRYRDGIIDGYPSRLHYTSDWIANNEKNDVLRDITKEIGGVPIQFNVNLISTQYNSNKFLQNRPDFVQAMKEIEQEINSRTYYYIPKNKIEEKKNEIRNGDIICFVTSREGLDISHVGIAYWVNIDKLGFIHASQTAGKVLIDPDSIADYSAKISHNIGIIVLRVN